MAVKYEGISFMEQAPEHNILPPMFYKPNHCHFYQSQVS